MISIIAALGDNREIGQEGKMPWYLPEDLKRFKQLTFGKTMVMGKKTFLSLPGVLPGRQHWIATRDPFFRKDHPRVRIIPNLDECWQDMRKDQEEYMLIGGGQIYSQGLPYADKLYLTWIHRTFKGADTYFPEIDFSQWDICDRSERYTNEEGFSYEFIDYVRRQE